MKVGFAEGGWDIVVDGLVPFGEVSDWKVILAKVAETQPDLVINTDYIPGNSALFLKQFLETRPIAWCSCNMHPRCPSLSN